MKRLLEQYGGMVLTMFLSIVVLTCFFHTNLGGEKGMPASLGQIIEAVILRREGQVKTGEEFDLYKGVSSPKVTINDSYVLRANQTVDISDWVSATDALGMPISVSVIRAWKDDCEYNFNVLEEGKIMFQESGEYWVELMAKDMNGYKRSVLTKVFVNER